MATLVITPKPCKRFPSQSKPPTPSAQDLSQSIFECSVGTMSTIVSRLANLAWLNISPSLPNVQDPVKLAETSSAPAESDALPDVLRTAEVIKSAKEWHCSVTVLKLGRKPTIVNVAVLALRKPTEPTFNWGLSAQFPQHVCSSLLKSVVNLIFHCCGASSADDMAEFEICSTLNESQTARIKSSPTDNRRDTLATQHSRSKVTTAVAQCLTTSIT